MSSPWQAVLAGLARGASGLGQRLEERELLEAKRGEESSERALRELVLRAQLARAQAPDTPAPPTPQFNDVRFTLDGKPMQGSMNVRTGEYLDALRNPIKGTVGIYEEPTQARSTPAPPQRQTDRGIEEWDGKQWVVTGRKPYQAPASADGLKTDFTRTQALQADYKGNPTVAKAYGTAGAVAGLKAALSGDSPLDDLSVIYETVKLFDPNSVVKENEIALARSANSLPAQVGLLVEGWRSGKKLTPQMRQWVKELMDRKVAEGQATVAPIQKEAGAMARRYGVTPDSAYIAPDPFAGLSSGAPPVNLTPAPIAPPGNTPRGLNRGPNVKWETDNRTPDQKDWDDAVAIHGREKVLKEYGPRP